MHTSGETGESRGAGAGVDLTLPDHLPRGPRLPQLRSRHEPVHLRQSHTRLASAAYNLEIQWIIKSDTTPTVRLSFNTARSYSGQYQGSAGGQYVGAGGQGQYGQYGSYGYAGHNLGGLQSK